MATVVSFGLDLLVAFGSVVRAFPLAPYLFSEFSRLRIFMFYSRTALSPGRNFTIRERGYFYLTYLPICFPSPSPRRLARR